MECAKLCNIYSYICSSKNKGVYVSNIMEKYGVKLSEMRSFIRLLDLFPEDIQYEILNENSSDENIIKKDTKIIIIDESYYLKNKYDEYISSAIEKVLKKSDSDNHIIDIIGNRISGKYIDKSNVNNMISEIREIKKEVLDSIINNKYINITYYCNNKIKNDNKVYVLGMYYDEVVNNYYIVLNDRSEVSLKEIKNIELLEEIKFNIKFNIEEYLQGKATEVLKLKVYDEANVIDKINYAFRNNKKEIEKFNEGYVYTINVDDPYKYEKMISNYGMSVIVVEPLELKENIIKETKEVIKALKNEPMQ